MKNKIKLIYLSFVLFFFLFSCGENASKNDLLTDIETQTISGIALKTNGAPFEVETTVFVLDSGGNVAKGKVKDNIGTFEVIFKTKIESLKKYKMIDESLFLWIGDPSDSDFMAVVSPKKNGEDIITINFNSISKISSMKFLKQIDILALYLKVKESVEATVEIVPKKIDAQTLFFLTEKKIAVTSSELVSIAKEFTNLLFGVDAVQLNFLTDSLSKNETVLLKAVFNTIGAVNIETVESDEFISLFNDRLFYQELALILPANISFSQFFSTIITPNSDVDLALNNTTNSQSSIANQLDEFLISKGDFTINVSEICPQFVIKLISDSNGSLISNGVIVNSTVVKLGENATIMIAPNFGYKIKTIEIDGLEIEPVYQYTFSLVNNSHNMKVSFKPTNVASIGYNTGPVDNIIDIAASITHTIVLKSNGTVVTWPESFDDHFPSFGLTDVIDVSAGNNFLAALKRDGSVVVWGTDNELLLSIPVGATEVKQIFCGDKHIVALKKDGTVVAWGLNDFGQTDVPLNLTEVVKVTAGYNHSVALKKDGTVVAWGANDDGEVNVPTNLSNVLDIAAGQYFTVAVKSDGTVVSWGYNALESAIDAPPSLTGVINIVANEYHTFALKNDGTVLGWGIYFDDFTPPEGLKDVVAIATGLNHAIALKKDGTIVTWGENGYIPSGLTTLTNISISDLYSVAINKDDSLISWPTNSLSDFKSITKVSINNGEGLLYNHGLALKSDGTVVSWGSNEKGQSTIPSDLSGVIDIAVGGYFSLALKSDGTVVAWGDNSSGQTTIPTGLTNVTSIAAGYDFVIALKSDGSVVSWGNNINGQTTVPSGLTGIVSIVAGYSHSIALKSDGSVVSWGPNALGESTIPIDLTDVTSIAAGAFHSVALKSDGTVVAWGDNSSGQTTIPEDLPPVSVISAGGNNTAFVFVEEN